MNEWLPDSFEAARMDERISSAIKAVRVRDTRRNRALRAAKWAAGAAIVLALAFFLAPKPNRHEAPAPDALARRALGAERDGARETGNQGNREGDARGEVSGQATAAPAPPAPSAPAPLAPREVPRSPSPPSLSSPPRLLTSSLPHEPAEVSVSKDSNGVELKWKGNPNEDYVVYRCTSPRFDNCDVAGVVKGTKWTDREADGAPLVFYKVEAKG